MTVFLTAVGLVVAYKVTCGVVAVLFLGYAIKRGPTGIG